MMKAILTSLFVIAVFANVYGQDFDTASVDIRAILEKQISEIKQRQETKADLISVETKQEAGIAEPVNAQINEQVEEFLSKDVAVKLFVLIEIVMLGGLVLLWFTKNRRNKKRQIKILKNNIKSLREERIGSRVENNLSKLRSALRFMPIKINDNGKDITFHAKKNNISKGEVHLAAKIKLMTGNYR